MSKTQQRRGVRSACGTYDYIIERDETICLMRVPEIETMKYSQRVGEILAAPDMAYEVAATHEVLDATGIANADNGQLMTLCERVEALVGLVKKVSA